MENEEILTTEQEQAQPQAKEKNAYYAARRRKAQADATPCEDIEKLSQIIEQQQGEVMEDLDAIRQKYPDETAQNVRELGLEYIGLCADGLPSMQAYEKLRTQQAQVPYMGDVSGEFAMDKEFYTKQEVNSMSKEQVKKNYSKIRNSMEKW